MVCNVPSAFIELGASMGLPSEACTEAYACRINNKTTEPLSASLVLEGYASTDAEAKRLLNGLWANWRRYSQSGTIIEGKQLVEMDSKPSDTLVSPVPVNRQSALDKAYEGLQRIIGKTNSVSGMETDLRKRPGATLVTSDYHIPFLHEPTAEAILNHWAEDLVIVGDFSDMYSASSHRKTNDYVSATEELALCRAFAEKLAKRFKRIRVIAGNHDNRVLKKAQTTVPQLMPLVVHPYEVIFRELANVEVLSLKIPDSAPRTAFGSDEVLNYAGIYEDVFLSHFEEFCGVEGVKKVDDFIGRFAHELKLATDPRIILHGHTHRLGLSYTPKGRLLVNTGCACISQRYVWDNHAKYQPPTQGYAVLYRGIDGRYDPSLTQIVHTGG